MAHGDPVPERQAAVPAPPQLLREDRAEVDGRLVGAAVMKTLGDGPQRAGALLRRREPHGAASHSQFALGEPLRDLGHAPHQTEHGLRRHADVAVGRREI